VILNLITVLTHCKHLGLVWGQSASDIVRYSKRKKYGVQDGQTDRRTNPQTYRVTYRVTLKGTDYVRERERQRKLEIKNYQCQLKGTIGTRKGTNESRKGTNEY